MTRLLAVLSIALFLGLHGTSLWTGGSWDRVEGVTASHQVAADQGLLHRGDPVGRIPLYGTAWYHAVALLSDGYASALAWGRILSILSSLSLAFAGFAFLRWRGVPPEQSLLGATLWLSWGPALQFGGVDRCDAPALLLSAGGWMLSFLNSRPLAFAGGCLAGLSSALRPTSGPEVLLWGAAVALVGASPRWRFWIVGAMLGGIGALSLTLFLEGMPALAHLALAGAAGPDPRQALDVVLRALPQAGPLLALGLLPLVPRAVALPVSVSLVLATFSLLRPGASQNWLLGPTFLLSLSLGMSARRIPRPLLWVVCLQTVAVQLPAIVQRLELATGGASRARAVAASPLPVLASETLANLRAGRRIPVEDPHLVESLGREGALPRDWILDSLRDGRWAVLADPDLLSGRPRYWSPSTVAWVRDSMVRCPFEDGVDLLIPRELPCPRSR